MMKVLTGICLLVLLTNGASAGELLWQGALEKKPVKVKVTHQGHRFSMLRALLADESDRLHLEITAKQSQDGALYTSRVTRNLNGEKGLEQLLDTLSQLPGTYDLEISGKGASCAVFLEERAPLDPFVAGPALGELIVTGVGGVPLSVAPDQFTVKHPGFKRGMEKGIATPNGDVIFRLPAGYWNLRRVNNGTENARLIPISSGKQTVVRWAVTPEISLDHESGTRARRLEIRSLTLISPKTVNPAGSTAFKNPVASLESGIPADSAATSEPQGSESALLQAVIALPPGLASAPPTLEQLQAFERFLPAPIVDLQPSATPLHLVLLLDSSGSMKKTMKPAIDAVVKFLGQLPADAVVEVIDFDTKARALKAKTRAELIKAVKAVKADGATALRDSILLGLDRLKKSPRPALVVFTDGFDANHNDTAPGSKATEADVFSKLKAIKIPVFTIGFGAGADAVTLGRLADLSGGLFQKADEQSLDEVFARLETTVAREYVLTCRRPTRPGWSNRPVISLCVDTSGSMEGALDKTVPGSRRVIARRVLHDLLPLLPPEALVQILDYDSNTEITQTATANRARGHAGIAAFGDGGGTDLLKAVKVALEGLLAVPSTRRYMLFLTDTAIKPAKGPDVEKFDRLLARLKDENIHTIWIGLVGKGDTASFIEVAKKSGGQAIVAANFDQLQKTLDELLRRVSEPAEPGRVPFELVWQIPQAGGAPLAVSGNGIFELPPAAIVGSTTEEVIDSLQIETHEVAPLAGQSLVAATPAADLASGPGADPAALPTTDLTLNHPSGLASEAVPGHAANVAAVTNQASKTPRTRHSKESPFVAPKVTSARLRLPLKLQGENRACRFTIHDMVLYDTIDGVNAPAKSLFAAFSVELTNILPEQDVVVFPEGSQHPAQWVRSTGREGKVIRAVPPYQISDVRRHLFLRWNSNPGVPCTPAGWLLDSPLAGFGSHALEVTPGRTATGTLVFLVPEDQGLTNGALDFFDTNYGHVTIAIAGTLPPADIAAANLPEKPTGKLGTAFQMTISGVRDVAGPRVGATAGPHLRWRLIDGVIESQVQALLDLDPQARLHLVLPTEAGPVRRPLSPVTALLPGGFYERVRLAPGATNHFQQAFLLPAELAAAASGAICVDMRGDDTIISLNPVATFSDALPERSWTATGNGLKLKLNAHGRSSVVANKKGDWYVVDVTVADLPDGRATRLDQLLFLGRADLKDQDFTLKPGQRMVTSSANKAKSKGIGSFAKGDEAAGIQTRIYADALNKTLLFGAHAETLVPDGRELRFVAVFKAPAAGEYLLAAEGIPLAEALNAADCPPLPAWLTAVNDEICPTLPETFEKNLAARLKQLAALRRAQEKTAVASRQVDENGTVTELPASLRPPLLHTDPVPVEGQAKIELSLEVEPIGDSAAAQTGAAASALGGNGRRRRVVRLLSAQVPAADLARSPVELVYAEVPAAGGGKALQASLIGFWGTETGRDSLDLKSWKPVREKITISLGKVGAGVSERDLDEKALPDRIHSLVIGIPDLAASAAADLTQRWKAARSAAAPDHLSLWQWFAHARLAGFITAQTAFEERLAAQLGVTLNRSAAPRLLVLTGTAAIPAPAPAASPCPFEARLDLVRVQPEVGGEAAAANAFRLAAGIFVTELEADILGGRGVFQFWGNNRLQVIADAGKNKNAWLKFAARRGVSERVIKAVRGTKSVVFFPHNPALVNGQPFWAWLEVNPNTFETIGVLETGERGTIAGEAIIQALIPDGAGIALGFWKGTETAIWGMSAFILRGDTTEQAIAATQKLIGDLSEHLGNVGDSFEVPVGDASIDLLSGKVSLAGFSSEGDYSPWDGYKGFVTGFNAGASWYLNKAKAKADGS
jgi:Mg-chelatase subunit ChlD